MELQFNKSVFPCLRKVVSQKQDQELTQEVKLPEAMPDIGRILCSWGQVIIRGKEWRSGGMTVSGGIMAWVLYAPEDGSDAKGIEAWIPFQQKWEFPETMRDGTIRVYPYLKAVDSRSISARKIMLRAGICLVGEAYEPVEVNMYSPLEVPEDVQLLKKLYPMEILQEAGEKAFHVEDEIALQATAAKILHYEIIPRITERKVMAGKLVFRGACRVHLLYAGEDGTPSTVDFEITFSQLSDLDRDYGPNATADINAVVTGAEMELNDEGKLLVKCGLAAQYVICDRQMIEIVEDAYSNSRNLDMHIDMLRLPVCLDTVNSEVACSETIHGDCQRIMEVSASWSCPDVHNSENKADIEIPGQLQVLYINETGGMEAATVRTEGRCSIASDPNSQIQLQLHAAAPVAAPGPDGIAVSSEIGVEMLVSTEQELQMVTALELGEVKEPDPARPSVVLRAAENKSLWELAKVCGSTVDAICTANHLEQEPVSNQILLIPVQ